MKACYINKISAICPDPHIVGEDGVSLYALEPEYRDIITNANQRRRMSRIVKMGVACGLMCLQDGHIMLGEGEIDSIITATGLGCVADTEKFMNVLIDNNEELLNPTAFIQSTFNTIGAQIALLSNNHSYNNTYVHRGLSFETALLDTMMRIDDGDRNVLVGAVDEITASSHRIMQRLGLLRNVRLGEGAQFFVVSANQVADTYCSLEAVQTFVGKYSPKEIENRITQFLSQNGRNASTIEILMTGNNGHLCQDEIYSMIKDSLFVASREERFKDICGEYHTASSFAVWKAANLLKNRVDANLLIYNHYNAINHSLILLRGC